MEKKVYDLKINEELAKVAPPISETELTTLREDILEHGCLSPLIVWNGVIVDGHNRYRICHDHDIPFGFQEMDFSGIIEAKLWIVKNQFGRRNLTPFQKCEMALPYEEEVMEAVAKRKRQAISDFRRGVEKEATLPPSRKTRQIMADFTGVSEGSYRKAKKIIESDEEELKEKLRAGDIQIHGAYTALRKKGMGSGDGIEKTEQDAENGAEGSVVPVYLEHPIPFEPDQRDKTPGEICEEFKDLFADGIEEAAQILNKLTIDNATEDLRTRLLKGLDDYYEEQKRYIADRFCRVRGGIRNEET